MNTCVRFNTYTKTYGVNRQGLLTETTQGTVRFQNPLLDANDVFTFLLKQHPRPDGYKRVQLGYDMTGSLKEADYTIVDEQKPPSPQAAEASS